MQAQPDDQDQMNICIHLRSVRRENISHNFYDVKKLPNLAS